MHGHTVGSYMHVNIFSRPFNVLVYCPSMVSTIRRILVVEFINDKVLTNIICFHSPCMSDLRYAKHEAVEAYIISVSGDLLLYYFYFSNKYIIEKYVFVAFYSLYIWVLPSMCGI